MAKRLLLFIVFSFVSVYFAWGQCNKEYILDVNKRFNLSSSSTKRIEKYLVCEGNSVELKLKDVNSDGLSFLWYKNDSLLKEPGSSLSIDKNGVYTLEIKDNNCTYTFGKFDLSFVRYVAQVNITTPQETICENTGSAYPLTAAAINGYLNSFNYQWQKDGKDLSNQRDYFHLPTTPGDYAVRASSGLCSTTSPAITIHKSPDNIILGDAFNILIDKTYNANFKSDTIVLCKDNAYTLQSARFTNWYLNDSLIATDSKYIPKQSGTYYTSETFRGNCYLKSKPVYILFDTKIPPIDYIHAPGRYLRCDLIGTGTGLDPNIRGNNQLRIYNATNNSLEYKFSNFEASVSQILKLGKYRIEYETGTCKSPPVDFEVKKITPALIPVGAWIKIINKKLTLCPNSMLFLSSQSNTDAEVQLYRDGILINTRQANHPSPSPFLITERGKYHMRIISRFCTPIEDVSTDTLEVEVPEPISTILSQDKKSCNLESLRATNYSDYTYSWYKDGIPLPNETSASLSLKAKEPGTYYAVLQKALCSVSTQSVTYARGFEDKILGQKQVCEGEKLVLASSIKEATYLWKGPNNISSNQAELTIDNTTVKNSGWYFLTTTKNNCSATDSIEVKITLKPDLSFRFLDPICPDEKLILNVSGQYGSYSLNYSLYDGLLTSQKEFGLGYTIKEQYLNLGTIPRVVSGDYKESMQLNFEGCSFPLTIPTRSKAENCDDILAFTNIKNKYCSQEIITLKLNIPKNIPITTQFRLSLKDAFNTIYNLGFFSGDSVQIKLPNAYGTSSFFLSSEDGKYIIISNDFNIINVQTSIFAPNERYFANSISRCDQNSTTLTVGFNSTELSFQWKKDDIAIDRARGTVFEAKESGKYTIVASSSSGCSAESNPFYIKTGEIPKPKLYYAIGNEAACNGFAIPLGESSGFAYTNYEWKHNNKIVRKTLKNDVFEAKESGYYKLTAYQGNCEATSDSLLVEVGQKLNNSITALGATPLKDNRIALCDQSIAKFNLISYNLGLDTLLHQKYGFHFQWKLNNKNIEGATKINYASAEAGIYQLQLSQGDCIVNSNTIEVIHQNSLRTPLVTAYYDAIGYTLIDKKDTIGICKGDAITIFFLQNFEETYNWSKELYKDGKLINTPPQIQGNGFEISESGQYSMKLSSRLQKDCAIFTDTLTLNFTNQPIHFPTDTLSSCSDTILLNTPIYGQTYQWYANDKFSGNGASLRVSEAGIYKLEVRKNISCSLIKSFLVEKKIKPILSYYWSNSSDKMCEGNETTLYLKNINFDSSKPTPDFTFKWYNNQQKLLDTNYLITLNQSGNYFAKVKYKDCEATSNAIKLEVISIKNQISPSADSLSICIIGGAQILEASKEVGYTYEWFKDSTALKESTSTLKATEEGTYQALIHYEGCSVFSPAVKIFANTPLPTATISGDTTLNMGDTANLKLSFTSSPPFTFKLSNNQEGTTDKNTIIYRVNIQESTIFKLASIKNACGEGTVSGEAKVNVIILGNEPMIGHKITIAPIPAESYCEIIFDLPVSQEVSYQLLDIKGQQLSEKKLGQVTYKKQYLNLNHLAAGEYLIRMQVGKDVVTRKLIKF